MIGKTLSHFRILARIGEGGMGVVYKAEDQNLQRLVALKVLPPELVADEARRLRFLREARAAAAITHPNIATIHEVDEAEGIVFIAMELVDEKTLRSLIHGHPLEIKDILRIAIEIAAGLAEAHKASVIHRDLKPDNVIVSVNGHVKILDFGLAKIREAHEGCEQHEVSRLETISREMTIQGKVLGTPAYMSPEQARGKSVDHRSDLFAFGTTLYEMVTGRTPFQGKTTTDTLSAIIRDTPLPPAHANPETPPELERIIGKCLEKDPADRYQHADELVVDLKRLRRATDPDIQTAHTPSASPVASASRSSLFAAGRTKQFILGGSLAAILLAGGVTVWRTYTQEQGFHSGDRIVVTDFENTTGRRELDTAIRDAFEERLSNSQYLQVIRGEQLKELVAPRIQAAVSRVDPEMVERSCGRGECAGYVAGRITWDRSGFGMEVLLQRLHARRPVASISTVVGDEGDLVLKIHEIALAIRKAVGETPQALGSTWPPTTRSLQAYQFFAAAARLDSDAEEVSLYKQALSLDSNFVDAYSALSISYSNLGLYRESREAADQAYRRSSGLSEQVRNWNEINLLLVKHDFDTAIDRLKAYQRLYPFDRSAANYLGWTYGAKDDTVSAEKWFRTAYELGGVATDLRNLAGNLIAEGKLEEAASLAADFRRKGGTEEEVLPVLLEIDEHRGDVEAVRKNAARLAQGTADMRNLGARRLAFVLLATGRFHEAEAAIAQAWRAAAEARSAVYQFEAWYEEAWLKMRRGEPAVSKRPAEVDPASIDVGLLPYLSTAAVEARLKQPLEELLRQQELSTRGLTSHFVREELGFARACLALLRGENRKALGLGVVNK